MTATTATLGRRHKMPEVVKSAVRALEILEFFDRRRGPASVGDIAADLNYPQSSTSALMRSLVKVGYLTYDAHRRAFMPTHRVPLRGSWLGEPFFQEGPVLSAARSIAERTGLAVGIARRNNNRLQWMHVCASDTMSAEEIHACAPSMTQSAVGLSLMAALDDTQIRSLLHRLNAEARDLSEVVRPADMMEQISTIRRDGHVFREANGFSMLAMTAPVLCGDEPVAIAVVDRSRLLAEGPTDAIEIMRETVASLADGFPPAGTVALHPAGRPATGRLLMATEDRVSHC